MYDLTASHYQIVWPIKAPPVSTLLWDNESWLKYSRALRPKGYEGGEFDKVAYKAWCIENTRQCIQRDYPNLTITYANNDLYRFERKGNQTC
jgi:hypothetical protein